MKKQIQIGFIIILIILSANTFGQTYESRSEKVNDNKVSVKTYLSILLNMVNTNINYGKSNSSLADNKKTVQDAQIGSSFQAGISPKFSLVSEFYFIRKGGRLKEDKSAGLVINLNNRSYLVLGMLTNL